MDRLILPLPENQELIMLRVSCSDGTVFWMGESEVTQEQYAALISAQSWTNIPRRDSTRTWFGESYGNMRIYMKNMLPPNIKKGCSLPVHSISWDEAFAWCEMLNLYLQNLKGESFQSGHEKKYVLRLPTVTELQTACDGGQPSFWCRSNSANGPKTVKTKEDNKLGFYDLIGNVSEWSLEALDMNGKPYWEPPKCFSLHKHSFGVNRIYTGGSWNSYESDCNPHYMGIDMRGSLNAVSIHAQRPLEAVSGGVKTIVTRSGIESHTITKQYMTGVKSPEIGFRVVLGVPIH